MENVEETTATVRIVLPLGSFYICAKRPLYEKERLKKDDVLFRHQGTALYNTVSISFTSPHLIISILLTIRQIITETHIRLNIKFHHSEMETIIYSSGLSDQHT